MDLLRKFQFDMMCPWAAIKQVPVRSCLLYHPRVHGICLRKLILPVVIALQDSRKKRLNTGVAC